MVSMGCTPVHEILGYTCNRFAHPQFDGKSFILVDDQQIRPIPLLNITNNQVSKVYYNDEKLQYEMLLSLGAVLPCI